jgi:hypothetical protein
VSLMETVGFKPYTNHRIFIDRYDRDTASARIAANMVSLIPLVAGVDSIANRIEADAAKVSLIPWEKADLARAAITLELAAANLRKAAGGEPPLMIAAE